ncbi:Cof-type HAD-IIB family hydrolase [Streptococcus macacae]|uniref:Cof-like hydrolase n=1 Tax=Streptococcus macacae NCTC 11558 TaxID=764298 RepID=G5JV27_9STRE|nr:Cof-type HAD-IIB family hydrolase [Streptococcus macacae]EHJ52913.1 Cof-like hydrolase [Streptococcus macacae NCTC 11558]SUN79331.1 Hydrolase, haloacid dehalogenase-like family [Streptococcus macacae NCTC 11558]
MKAIFSDIDGTLINKHFQVTERTKIAIWQAVKKGMHFIPVSARMPEAIIPIMDSIGIVTPVISYNGALIQDQDKEIIASNTMETEIALAICQFISDQYPQIVWNVYSYHAWFSEDRQNDWIQREEAIVNVKSQESSLLQLEALESVHKVLLMGSPTIIGPLERELKRLYPSLSIAQSAPYLIEIMTEGIKKGHAVKVLSDHMGIALSETIAFGDNFNDLDMLETVGTGYVMGNGPKEVQNRIGNSTADHDHDGIAMVLEKYL